MCDWPYPTENHSEDTVTVYCGRPQPLTMCGYHESRLDPKVHADIPR